MYRASNDAIVELSCFVSGVVQCSADLARLAEVHLGRGRRRAAALQDEECRTDEQETAKGRCTPTKYIYNT